MLTRACMHQSFETLATLSPLAGSSQVREPEIENSIWNASLEIGKWNGKRNEYRHGTYRPPYIRETVRCSYKGKAANVKKNYQPPFRMYCTNLLRKKKQELAMSVVVQCSYY